MIAQSTTDQVVLPQTTASVVERWCAAGTGIGTLWLNGVTHQETAAVAGPAVVQWIGQRLMGGGAAPDDCAAPPPISG